MRACVRARQHERACAPLLPARTRFRPPTLPPARLTLLRAVAAKNLARGQAQALQLVGSGTSPAELARWIAELHAAARRARLLVTDVLTQFEADFGARHLLHARCACAASAHESRAAAAGGVGRWQG